MNAPAKYYPRFVTYRTCCSSKKFLFAEIFFAFLVSLTLFNICHVDSIINVTDISLCFFFSKSSQLVIAHWKD